MRICHLTPEYPGCGASYGIGRYVADLVGLLRAGGDAVRVVVVNESGIWHEDAVGQVQHLPATGGPGLLRPWRLRRHLAQAIAAWRAEVVEAPNWGGLAAWLPQEPPLVLRISTPVALTGLRGPASRLVGPAHRAQDQRAVHRAALVVADSHTMAQRASAVYRRPVDLVITHGWTGPHALPPTSSNTPGLLCVGRCEHRKGQDRLLRAWPLVRAAVPDAALHLVGGDAWGLGRFALPGVTVHGRVDDETLAGLRRAIPVAVVPSRFESFGLVVLEAWAAGQATVVADAGALPEVVGTAGLVVDAGNPRALAGAAVSLLDDPQRRRALAVAGGERLATHFAPGPWVQATRAAYRRAIARARPRSARP